MIRTISGNGQQLEVAFNENHSVVSINGNVMPVDLLRFSSSRMHLLFRNKSWNVEILSLDRASKMARVKINNHEYDVQLKERMDDLLAQLGMESKVSTDQKEVKAPMPGMVLQIMVNEGQHIEKDEPLIILEAMKMENVIKSPVQGTIKRVPAIKGAAVDKNTVLIEFS